VRFSTVRYNRTEVNVAQRVAFPAARLRALPLIAVLLNALIAIALAATLNLWQDEAYTLVTTGRDLSYAAHQAIVFEQNAPLYFLAMTLWRHAGDSVLFMRMFSVLCGIGTLAIMPALAQRYIPQINSGLVTIVTALNPFFIWAEVEIRVYAAIVLLSAALLLFFFDAFLAAQPNRRSTIAYAALVTVALYTQYYFAFFIAAAGVVVLCFRRDAFVRFIVATLAGSLPFIPMLVIVPTQLQNYRAPFEGPHSMLRSGAVIASILARFVFPLLVAHAKIIYAAAAAISVSAAIAFRRIFRPGGDAALPVLLLAAATLFAAAAYAGHILVLNRHVASLFLPAVLSAFATLTFLPDSALRRAEWMLATLCLGLSAVALVQTYAALAKPGDWIRVDAYIHSHERHGEPIVIFEAENALPFAYYYRGPNRVAAIPRPVNFNRYDPSRFVLHSVREAASGLPSSQRFWLITAGECSSAELQFGCDELQAAISRYRILEDADFYGSRVRLLSVR